MQLKSFGCSFVYGSDLEDCPHDIGARHPPPSNLTWPALLAQRYLCGYQCHARPAAGNLQILETLLSNIDDPADMIVIVNWTWIDRFSYTRESEKKLGSRPWNINGWCSLLPGHQDPVTEMYYKHLHSQFRDKLETLMCIKTAGDFMLSKGIDFLMTYTDDLILETGWHTSLGIAELQNGVRPFLTDFGSCGYWTWINRNGFPISDRWHPLEAAHEAAAELMAPAIDAILRKA